MDLKELIISLSQARGPSGFEGAAADLAEEYLRPYVDDVRRDVMGSCIAVKRCGKENAPVVMLDAHTDEIGFIVTGYEKGFLRFQNLGGVDARMLPALEVIVLAAEPLRGVIDTLPPHVLTAAEQEKPLDAEKLFIDVGLSEEEAKEKVPLGTPVVFASPCLQLGENRLCGKSMDDRSCAAVLIEALRLLQGKDLDCDVAVALAVQEEVGCRGAITAAYGIHPEAALAVDVTHGETPDAPKGQTYPLAKGPAIAVGPNMTRSVSDKLIALARANDIPYQVEVIPGCSGTDGWVIQVSREGVATGVASLPLKYMHTPVEVLDLRDAENLARLIALWVENYGKEA